jgi:hypothetical protein
MTVWEFLGVALSSAGLFASILGAFLTYAARQNGKATRDLIRSLEEQMTKHFSELLERMDKRAEERHLDMDRRADDRHREVIEAIRAIKAA